MNLRLDIESLRAVKSVAECGNITQAARRLNLTQSAVSHKIKRLEERLGRILFRRNEGSFTTTQDGDHLLRYAERLVEIHDEAAAMFSRSDLSGPIRLGITDNLSGPGIARILARFSAVYPNVSLVSRVAHSVTLGAWLKRGEIDLALMQLFDEDALADDRVLWRDDVVWAASEDFRVSDDRYLPFIAFHERCFYRSWAIEALKGLETSLIVVLECPSVEGVTNAVRSGLGLTLIDRRNLRSGMIVSTRPLPQPPRVTNVARAAVEHPGETVVALMNTVEEELRENQFNYTTTVARTVPGTRPLGVG